MKCKNCGRQIHEGCPFVYGDPMQCGDTCHGECAVPPKAGELRKLIKFPVRCDEYGMYIFDADGETIADTNTENGAVLRVRGWGRLQRELGPEDAAKAQKIIGDAFADALNKANA